MRGLTFIALVFALVASTSTAMAAEGTVPSDSVATDFGDLIPIPQKNDAFVFNFYCMGSAPGNTNTGWMDERITRSSAFEQSGTRYSSLRCNKVCLHLAPHDRSFWTDPSVTNVTLIRERVSLADVRSTTPTWTANWNLGNPNTLWTSNLYVMPDGDVTETSTMCWDAKWTDTAYAVLYNYTATDTANYAYRLKATFTDAGGVVHTFYAEPYFPGVQEIVQ